MADWYNPWQVGTYNQDLAPLELMNLFMPYMAPAEQASAAQYLFSQRHVDPTMGGWLANYNVPSAGPTSTSNWLANVNRASNAQYPDYYEANMNPEYSWLTGLTGAAKQLGPNMNRQQQQQWRSTYDTQMAQAPNDSMKALGAYLYNPSLTRPEFGSAAPLGQYSQRYHQKAGLVSNPYYL